MSHVKLVLDDDEEKKLETLKKEYGIKLNSELVRFLITDRYKAIKRENSKPLSESR